MADLVTYCSGTFADGSTWAPRCGTCASCGVALATVEGLTRSWGWYCSGACRRVWQREHQWPKAKAAALKRAGYKCEFVDETRGVRRSCLQTRGLEVDHIVPRSRTRARLGKSGCENHSANLRVLCQRHHQEKTRRDRAGQVEAVA